MNHNEHIYWHHRHLSRKVFAAANRLATDLGCINFKRKYQPEQVVALYDLARAHASAAAEVDLA